MNGSLQEQVAAHINASVPALLSHRAAEVGATKTMADMTQKLLEETVDYHKKKLALFERQIEQRDREILIMEHTMMELEEPDKEE